MQTMACQDATIGFQRIYTCPLTAIRRPIPWLDKSRLTNGQKVTARNERCKMLTIAVESFWLLLFFAVLPYLIVVVGWLIGIGLCVAAVGAVIYPVRQADAATLGVTIYCCPASP